MLTSSFGCRGNRKRMEGLCGLLIDSQEALSRVQKGARLPVRRLLTNVCAHLRTGFHTIPFFSLSLFLTAQGRNG